MVEYSTFFTQEQIGFFFVISVRAKNSFDSALSTLSWTPFLLNLEVVTATLFYWLEENRIGRNNLSNKNSLLL